MGEGSNRPKIIGITGHVRSGKTYAADYIGRRFGALVFKNSMPLGEVVARLGEVGDREMIAKLGLSILDVFGRDLIARHWLRAIEIGDVKSLCVVEGIRYEEELEFYREVADFKLVGIRTGDLERYRRAGLADDKRKDDGKSLAQFLDLKSLPNEVQVDGIVSRADLIIDNHGSLDEFNGAIDRAVKTLFPGLVGASQ